MKIIGRTESGYIVEAEANELARCAGFASAYSAAEAGDHQKPNGFSRDHYSRPSIAFGTKIEVNATFRYLENLREQEAKCKSSAAFLHGMADMLDGAMPTTLIPPTEDEVAK